jgi:hypothetical protein
MQAAVLLHQGGGLAHIKTITGQCPATVLQAHLVVTVLQGLSQVDQEALQEEVFQEDQEAVVLAVVEEAEDNNTLFV